MEKSDRLWLGYDATRNNLQALLEGGPYTTLSPVLCVLVSRRAREYK